MSHGMKPSPDLEASCVSAKKKAIVDFWNVLSCIDDSGGTTWDVLDNLRDQVTALLLVGTPDAISKANRLTSEAMYLLVGGG